jgi:hypothetical protein
MVISARRLGPALSARATKVTFTADAMVVHLEDGRRISVPIVWFPKLAEATEEQRKGWRLIGRGIGISWEELDEDISVENLLGARGDLLTYQASPEIEEPTPPTPGTAAGVRSRVFRVERASTPPPPNPI